MADWSNEIRLMKQDKAAYKAGKAEKVELFEAEWSLKKAKALAEITLENDIAYGRTIKRWADSGVPQGVIRQALGLTRWDDWKRFRDLGGIEPVRDMQAAVRAEREARSRGYVLDGTTFTVYRTEHGEFDPPLVIPNVVTDYDSPVNPTVPLDAIRPVGEEMAEFDAEFFKNAYVDVWKLLVEIKKGNIK